jgi:hypothetical protein
MQLLAFAAVLASCCGTSDNGNKEVSNVAVCLDATFVNRKWFGMKKNTKRGRFNFDFDEKKWSTQKASKKAYSQIDEKH